MSFQFRHFKFASFAAVSVFSLTVGGALARENETSRALAQISDVEKKFNVRVKSASLQAILEVLLQKAGLELSAAADLGTVSGLNLSKVNLVTALDTISEQNNLTYHVQDRTVFFKKKTGGGTSEQGGGRFTANIGGPKRITATFYPAAILMQQLQGVIEKDEYLVLDDLSNSIIFQGSERSYEKIMSMVTLLDQMPKQVLIEARVVETSKTFMQNIGFSWGLGQGAVQSRLSGKLGTTAALRYRVGTFVGANLDVNLAAAESRGDAKVISRPRVVTLNNTIANINSGISFNVRTLTPVLAAGGRPGANGGGNTSNLTGGITTLQAGLQLGVTPQIMGDDLVKMIVKINNSTPDEGAAVDGIPGILNNSANTTVIVGQGRTAVIAGLIKNANSESKGGVPILSSIPLIGALFRNQSESDRNNELVIFLTPHIVDPSQDLAIQEVPEPYDDELPKPDKRYDAQMERIRALVKKDSPGVPVQAKANPGDPNTPAVNSELASPEQQDPPVVQ